MRRRIIPLFGKKKRGALLEKKKKGKRRSIRKGGLSISMTVWGDWREEPIRDNGNEKGRERRVLTTLTNTRGTWYSLKKQLRRASVIGMVPNLKF